MRNQLSTAFLLTGLATPLFFAAGKGFWIPALWVGVGWGLLNFLCMTQVTRVIVEGRRGWRLAGWVALKVLGLYGALAWLLLGARVSPLGWLAGFTLSLVASGLNALTSLRGVTAAARRAAPALFVLLSSALAEASEAVRGSEAAHAAAAAPAHPPEIPNLITLITHFMPEGPVQRFLHTWENAIFAFVIAGLVGGLLALAARRLAMRPGRGQMLAETVIEGLDNLVCGVLGPKEGRRYLPFLGTLFLFILSMNLAGLIPGLKSPTSRFEMTGALGLCVFSFVQWTGIRRLGFGTYLYHFLGEPKNLFDWVVLAPLMLFIHGVGEIVKPVSLSLRLFGNLMGEDILLGVFVGLGALSFAWSHLPIGIPLHLPFILLAMIFSTVQALVFTVLSMIYIYMMLPHEEHGH